MCIGRDRPLPNAITVQFEIFNDAEAESCDVDVINSRDIDIKESLLRLNKGPLQLLYFNSQAQGNHVEQGKWYQQPSSQSHLFKTSFSVQAVPLLGKMTYFADKHEQASRGPNVSPPRWTLAPGMSSWSVSPRKIVSFVLAMALVYYLNASLPVSKPHKVRSQKTCKDSIVLTLINRLNVRHI